MFSESESLNERKQIILKAIVHDYTSTAEPVSSEMLAYRCRLGVKPATIRNEMAELSEMGYLRQPHTSAGRVPSDLGYRFYVDRLMSGPGLSSAEESGVMETYSEAPAEMEELLHLTCRVLSTLTHYASVAMEPANRTASIRHISLSMIDSRKLLLAVVTTNGSVEHSILELSHPVTQSKVSKLCAALTSQYCGLPLDSLPSHGRDFVPEEARTVEAEYKLVARAVRQIVRSMRKESVFMEGAGHILSQPEFKDIAKLETLLMALEERRVLYQTLTSTLPQSHTTIIIGHENPCVEMRDCSFVAAPYCVGGRTCGAVGVLGPTRMNYRRAVAAVSLMAQSLTDLLSSISAE
jgi:heat-inducible transcriptional repressor